MKREVLKDILEIKAKVDALVLLLEAEETSKTASIEEVRKVAILEEIERLGGSAEPDEISAIAKKYGKMPSSTAGYYSGKCPSLVSYITSGQKSIRRLTTYGNDIVQQYREKWGIDWLDRIPLDIVGNPNTKSSEIVF